MWFREGRFELEPKALNKRKEMEREWEHCRKKAGIREESHDRMLHSSHSLRSGW